MQNYELYCILKSDLDSDSVKSEINIVQELLETQLNAQNIQVEAQGLKKLAYPIRHERSGYYVLLTYEINDDKKGANFTLVEKKLNLNENIIRYLNINQTHFLKLKAKEKLNTKTEVKTHRDLNKANSANKKCIVKHIGMEAIDYKDIDFLSQFVSPYSKIFGRSRTGTSAKYQRKVTTAIKRARHMALMPFTPQH